MQITFATPWWALAGLAGLLPLAGAVVRERSLDALREELDLPATRLAARSARPVGIAALFALLALTVAQPAVRRQHARTARQDAQLIVVVDSSRSMLAAARRNAPTRIERAVTFAHRLHGELGDVPIGVASLTNRLLPFVFPTSHDRAFGLVLDQAVAVEQPPPVDTQLRWVTTFQPLMDTITHDYFSPGVRRRVLVVLSDAETRPFAERAVIRSLRTHGIDALVVRFWRPTERVFRPGGGVESYRPTDPGALGSLKAAGWPTYTEAQLPAVVAGIREAIGKGTSTEVALERRDETLAPLVAVLALCPLLLLIVPSGQLPALRRLVFS